MSYKMQKIRNAADLEKMSKLQSEIRKLDKENDAYRKQVADYYYIVSKFERIMRLYYDKDIDMEQIIKSLENRDMLLPENINIDLNEKGIKYNSRITNKELREGW